jgi:hypothetical protein
LARVTFASGYLAGIFCAIVSHPADTIVSKLNNMKTEGKNLKPKNLGSLMTNVSKIYGEIGMAGLWRGLGTRIFMIGTLTGYQIFLLASRSSMVDLRYIQDNGWTPNHWWWIRCCSSKTLKIKYPNQTKSTQKEYLTYTNSINNGGFSHSN